MSKLIGYELFLPAIVASIRTKEKDDDQLTDGEIKATVAVVYRDAVIKFMKDSALYRTEIPIDLYKDVKRYDIIPPDGYHIESIISFKEHKTYVPKHLVELNSIELICCPTKSVDAAFFIEVGLVAKRSSGCEFDEDFVDKYYEVILNQMFFRLTSMPARLWRSLGQSVRYQRDYMNGVNDAKRQALNGGAAIKLETRRLSANDPSC